ncbi:MAG: hypothetical protein OJF49_003133 [Ktedonobacterales bacterium]|jgi:uncharacterized protein YndB with AHSA1/START domain|nr:MAG: hypothetical protein OJF49_003133 [Ktedonobacterales bacterium]
MQVLEAPSETDRLVVVADYPNVAPEVVFAYWTRPELIRQWWPQEAELDARPGGAYALGWPERNWRLRGWYTRVEPGRTLAFTWQWDSEQDEAEMKAVVAHFEPLGAAGVGGTGGTRLTLTHGPYTDDDAGREARTEHLDGWQHFLARLGEALAGA